MSAALSAFLGAVGATDAGSRTWGRMKQLEETEKRLKLSATVTESLGALETHVFQRRAAYARGGIPAAAAASGVRAGVGSAFDVLIEQARNDASEAGQIKTSRLLQAYGLREEARMADHQHKMLSRQIHLDMFGGFMKGASGGGGFGGDGAGAGGGSS